MQQKAQKFHPKCILKIRNLPIFRLTAGHPDINLVTLGIWLHNVCMVKLIMLNLHTKLLFRRTFIHYPIVLPFILY